jgi:hypothetical protein
MVRQGKGAYTKKFPQQRQQQQQAVAASFYRLNSEAFLSRTPRLASLLLCCHIYLPCACFRILTKGIKLKRQECHSEVVFLVSQKVFHFLGGGRNIFEYFKLKLGV